MIIYLMGINLIKFLNVLKYKIILLSNPLIKCLMQSLIPSKYNQDLNI